MTRSPTVGFDRRDWLRLLGSLASGGVVAFVALQGLLNTVLEPQLVAESVRRIDRNVRLVEVALDQ